MIQTLQQQNPFSLLTQWFSGENSLKDALGSSLFAGALGTAFGYVTPLNVPLNITTSFSNQQQAVAALVTGVAAAFGSLSGRVAHAANTHQHEEGFFMAINNLLTFGGGAILGHILIRNYEATYMTSLIPIPVVVTATAVSGIGASLLGMCDKHAAGLLTAAGLGIAAETAGLALTTKIISLEDYNELLKYTLQGLYSLAGMIPVLVYRK
jgi:hypothetical protein